MECSHRHPARASRHRRSIPLCSPQRRVAEIGPLPHRDRSSSASRSVHFRVEIGSRRRSDAGRAPGRLVPGLGALPVGRVVIPCGLEAVDAPGRQGRRGLRAGGCVRAPVWGGT
ncbi:MAG: hypothetical protein DI576_11985 [Actinomyces sp.]|nr:MAG: hypothetical protein DI576_11985 [Actinomyces sp.]